jgi:plastocyanin
MGDKAESVDPVGEPHDRVPAGSSGGPASGADPAYGSRRKLIDELVQTGVPAVAASEAGLHRRPWSASLYVIIPLVALGVLVGLRGTDTSENSSPDGGRPVDAATQGAGNNELVVTAENISFDTDSLTLNAGSPTLIHFENRDAPSVQHNLAIYEDSGAQDPIFQGDIIAGGTEAVYEFTAPTKGEYFFRCDVHPSMNGTVVVEP